MLTSYHQTQMWTLFLENKTLEIFKFLGAVLCWCENYYNLTCCQTFTMQDLKRLNFTSLPFCTLLKRDISIWEILMHLNDDWLSLWKGFVLLIYLLTNRIFSSITHRCTKLAEVRKVGARFLRKYYSAGWLLKTVPSTSAFHQQAKLY